MSRNGSGTYTLPAGNPVVTGTTIESTWANTTLSDIATTLTDSLSRSGQGGMTAALRIADGTQGAPGLGFANETGSGLYRAGTGEVWAVVQGAQTMNLDANGVTVPSDKATSIEGTFVFNETGADKDARFEGDTDANLLFVDASADAIGIGTSSPGEKLAVSQGNIYALRTGGAKLRLADQNNEVSVESSPTGAVSNMVFKTSATTQMTLDSSGNLGLGVTSISGFRADILSTSTDAALRARSSNSSEVVRVESTGTSSAQIRFINTSVNNTYISAEGTALAFLTAANERARITSGGDLLVGTTGNANNYKTHILTTGAGAAIGIFQNNATTPYGINVYYGAASPNNSNANTSFLYCNDLTTLRIQLASNGGVINYQANDSNLSDRREKTDFAPAKSYLDTICAIPVQTFKYIDQTDDAPTLGVVAQDVQAAAPELVMESNWGTEDNPKMRLSIYQTDLQYALMKCIQEQQELIKDLRARVAALEAA